MWNLEERLESSVSNCLHSFNGTFELFSIALDLLGIQKCLCKSSLTSQEPRGPRLPFCEIHVGKLLCDHYNYYQEYDVLMYHHQNYTATHHWSINQCKGTSGVMAPNYNQMWFDLSWNERRAIQSLWGDYKLSAASCWARIFYLRPLQHVYLGLALNSFRSLSWSKNCTKVLVKFQWQFTPVHLQCSLTKPWEIRVIWECLKPAWTSSENRTLQLSC